MGRIKALHADVSEVLYENTTDPFKLALRILVLESTVKRLKKKIEKYDRASV